MKITGKVKLECRKDGKLLWATPKMKNVITSAGKAQVALLVGDASAVPFTYLALGTGTTAESASQTALVTEITDTGLARAAATVSRTTTTVTNDTHRLTYTWTATGTKTIEEIGAFNAASTGTMLGRKLTSSRTVNDTEELTATYDFIFS